MKEKVRKRKEETRGGETNREKERENKGKKANRETRKGKAESGVAHYLSLYLSRKSQLTT